jgi:hypothetical protein
LVLGALSVARLPTPGPRSATRTILWPGEARRGESRCRLRG